MFDILLFTYAIVALVALPVAAVVLASGPKGPCRWPYTWTSTWTWSWASWSCGFWLHTRGARA